MPTTVSVGSYNLGDHGKPSEVLRLVAEQKLDIIGFQEMADRDGIKPPGGYRWFWPHGMNRDENPILFNENRFRLIKSGSEAAHGRVFVGRKGAGAVGGYVHYKWINWVKLEEKETNRVVFFCNNHYIPSIYIPIRRKLWIRHRNRNLAFLIRRRRDRLVISVGDHNATLDKNKSMFSPFFTLAKLQNTWGDHPKATHGTRTIDFIWYRPRRFIKVTHADALDGYGSDHKPIVGTFELD